jgi:hypothetical protein
MTSVRKPKPSSIVGLAIAAVLALVASTACSLGGNPSASGGGVASFGKGVITAKGSVFVNGIEYDTSSSAISVNGAAGSDSDLKVGMLVEVKGSADSATGKGRALQILYSAEVDGPVGSIDLAAKSFTVFTRTVSVDSATIWEGVAGIASLGVGDRVEVSGSVDSATSSLKADRVQKKAVSASAEDYKIKGIVSAISAGSLTLTVPDGAAALTVNYSGSLDPAIAVGTKVEVRFSTVSGTVVATTADEVRAESHLSADDQSHGELSGRVSDFLAGASASTFAVEGVPVSADNSLVSGLTNGVKVEVRGSMAGGVLVAESVKIERETNAELRGTVSAIATSLDGLTVDGVAIGVDSRTRFRDENESGGAVPVEHFGLANIAVGDYLEIGGSYDAAAIPSFSADRVERRAPGGVDLVKGPVSAVGASSLTILGTTVDISGLAGASALLASVVPGSTIVEARGGFAAGILIAVSASADD